MKRISAALAVAALIGFAGERAAAQSRGLGALAVLSMMGVVLLYDFLAPRSRARLSLAVGFGLLVGGGLGNLVDRWRLGLVTDFIRSGERAFNIADVAIFSGGLIILTALVVTLVRILVQGPAAVQPTSRGG